MKARTYIAVLLLLAAGLQTASAQTVILKLKNNKTVSYSILEVDSIHFSETTLHEWVDLGLPSGTLWATCNVGAATPEEGGYYFAWGETEQKESYSWDTYKYCQGTDHALTKYCIDSSYGYNGYTDGLTELLPEDDAATAKWGSEWQMPSQGQMEELFDKNYTTVAYMTQNDVAGYKITSLINRKSIFLPVTGEMNVETLVSPTTAWCYWTRSLCETKNRSGMVYIAILDSSTNGVYTVNRNFGHAVRPVRVQETPYQWPVKGILIEEENVTVQKGETKQINATVSPTYAYNKTLAWESSNESVATVTDGKITGVSSGTSVITCRATDGSGVSVSFVVTVTQQVTRISLNPTSLTLSIGNSQTITATVYPSNASNKTLSWESSNTNIATVDQYGKITAKAKGNCTITCRATDGSGKYATCAVTVVQYVTGISIRSSLSLAIGKSQTLSVTVYPSDATNPTVSWSSSDSNIASVNQSGTVTAKAKGTCTITCSATDGSGKYATCKVTVLQLVTGIKLSQSSLSMLRDIPQQLTATVLPSDASNTEVRWSSSNTNIATVNQQGWVTAKTQGNCVIYCQAIDDSGVKVECQVKVSNYPQYVDLGLPSGTLWATLNIGANNPWEAGDYFAWGEKEPNKASYDWSTYSLCNGTYYSMTKYNASDGKTELDPVDDAASVIWGVDWQMPSSTQRVELMDTRYVNLEWTTQNGVYGLKVKSKKNGNYIFLPVGGYRSGSELLYTDGGNYWSRSVNTINSIYYTASAHHFNSSNNYGQTWLRSNGLNIRPVRKQ